MKDLKIDDNTVIYCPTEQLAKEVCNLFHKLGYQWGKGNSYLNNSEYYLFENQTCYKPQTGSLGTIGYYQSKGRTICGAIDFLNSHGYTIIEEKVLVEFDLKKAKSGAEVVAGKITKTPARIICDNARIEHYPLVALVRRRDAEEVVVSYSNEGRSNHQLINSDSDLFIIEPALKITPPQIKKMTIEEIEQQLGFKIKIVNK